MQEKTEPYQEKLLHAGVRSLYVMVPTALAGSIYALRPKRMACPVVRFREASTRQSCDLLFSGGSLPI